MEIKFNQENYWLKASFARSEIDTWSTRAVRTLLAAGLLTASYLPQVPNPDPENTEESDKIEQFFNYSSPIGPELLLGPVLATPTIKLFNYCDIKDSTDPLDHAANIPVITEYEGDLGKITQITIEPIHIVSHRDITPDELNIVIWPVGFTDEEISGEFPSLTQNLNSFFSEVNINFSYLSFPVPLSLSSRQRNLGLKNPEEIRELYLKTFEAIDYNFRPAILLKSDKQLGGYNEIPMATSHSIYKNYILTHEVGHLLGLDDAYQAFADPEYLNGTELFLSTDGLRPNVNTAYQNLGFPPIYPTRGMCNGDRVYKFTNADNLMDIWIKDSVLIETTSLGQSIFNPMQKEIMKAKAQEFINRFK